MPSCFKLPDSQRMAMSEAKTTHGHGGRRVDGKRVGQTREYRSWKGMKVRCNNPNNPRYKDYGARGITVCDEWLHSFETFLFDMGPSPSSKHSIDRINNHLGYSKENCRWATRIEQNNNKRSNRMITVQGRTQSVAMWCRELHLTRRAVLKLQETYART